MGNIVLLNVAKFACGCLYTEIMMNIKDAFTGLGIIGNSFNASTIAPKMVLFDMKFAFHQSHGYSIIIRDTNTFQRLHVFVD